MSAQPNDPNVRVITQQTPAPTAAPVPDEVVETATKIVRAKTALSNTLKKVGPLVVVGASSAFAMDVLRNRRSASDDNDIVVDFNDTDTDTE